MDRNHRQHARRCLSVFIGALACAAALSAQIEPRLRYQDRGDRHEGLRGREVSGYDIELLAAQVEHRGAGDGWPEQLRLSFYLPQAADVFVTVRQLRPRSSYYWLDKIDPPTPWRAQAVNRFTWSTAPVLARLPSVHPADLGAVVRLERAEPGKRELVAPALLHHGEPPPAVEGYRFTWKTTDTALVTDLVELEGTEPPVAGDLLTWRLEPEETDRLLEVEARRGLVLILTPAAGSAGSRSSVSRASPSTPRRARCGCGSTASPARSAAATASFSPTTGSASFSSCARAGAGA